jgi:hypothetical protein
MAEIKKKRRSRKSLNKTEVRELEENVYLLLDGKQHRKSKKRIEDDLVAHCGWKRTMYDKDYIGIVLKSLIFDKRAKMYVNKWEPAEDSYWRLK